MKRTTAQFGRWSVECLPEDGARIASLEFDGRVLLTASPSNFRPPEKDYGQFETRPVYGYDDCFPTVDACCFPCDGQMKIPDHGDLCWLAWQVEAGENCLDCSVQSSILPVNFRRRMLFGESSLQWRFDVENESDREIPFLHVMHALLPLAKVEMLRLPEFTTSYDEMNQASMNEATSDQITQRLLDLPGGTAEMLLLRGVKDGCVEVSLKGGLRLSVEFPVEMFPTLGIWWNNGGYPDEAGCRRTECAFEPIPGTLSSLADSYADHVHLTVPPQGQLEWTIVWTIRT